MRVTCTITGTDDSTIEADVEDDQQYTPEIVSDWLRRCGESVVWIYQQTHAAKP